VVRNVFGVAGMVTIALAVVPVVCRMSNVGPGLVEANHVSERRSVTNVSEGFNSRQVKRGRTCRLTQKDANTYRKRSPGQFCRLTSK
jgi:hypothetical protein